MVNWPKFRVGVKGAAFVALSLCVSHWVYRETELLIVSFASGFLTFIVVLFSFVRVRERKFRHHLSHYGTMVKPSREVLDSESYVLGVVPFQDSYAAGRLIVDAKGVYIGLRRYYRYIEWEDVVAVRRNFYRSHPVLELSVGSLELASRLTIPWRASLNPWLPEELQ